MTIAYFDCFAGISGDMTLGALIDAGANRAVLDATVEALLLLTDFDTVRVAGSTPLSARTTDILAHWQKRWEGEGTDWAGALVGSRYDSIAKLCADIVQSSGITGPSPSDKIDAVVIHPVWGWLVFGSVMTLFFLSIFTFAQAPSPDRPARGVDAPEGYSAVSRNNGWESGSNVTRPTAEGGAPSRVIL